MKKEQLILLAKANWTDGNTEVRKAIESIFPNIDFTKRKYKEDETFILHIPFKIDYVEKEDGDELGYGVSIDISRSHMWDIDDNEIYISEKFIDLHKKI